MEVSREQIEYSVAKAQEKYINLTQKKENDMVKKTMELANKKKHKDLAPKKENLAEEVKKQDWIPIADFINATNTNTKTFKDSVKRQDSMLKQDVSKRNQTNANGNLTQNNPQKSKRQSQILEIQKIQSNLINKQTRFSVDVNTLSESNLLQSDNSQNSQIDEEAIESSSPFKQLTEKDEEQSLETETSEESSNYQNSSLNERDKPNYEQTSSQQLKKALMESKKEENESKSQQSSNVENRRSSILFKPKKKAFNLRSKDIFARLAQKMIQPTIEQRNTWQKSLRSEQAENRRVTLKESSFLGGLLKKIITQQQPQASNRAQHNVIEEFPEEYKDQKQI